MKKVLALVLIGLATVLVSSVQAQTPIFSANTLYNSAAVWTNVAGTSATNFNLVMDVRKQAKVMVQLSQVYDGAGTANTVYYFQRSVDGTTYDFPSTVMTGSTVVTVVGTGNTAVTTLTNLDTAGCGYIRLAWVTNASVVAVNLTNLVVKYGLKISAP